MNDTWPRVEGIGAGWRTRARRARPVCFPHRMPPPDQHNRLFVVHAHAGEGAANFQGARVGPRTTLGAFRVHVNQAQRGARVRARAPVRARRVRGGEEGQGGEGGEVAGVKILSSTLRPQGTASAPPARGRVRMQALQLRIQICVSV